MRFRVGPLALVLALFAPFTASASGAGSMTGAVVKTAYNQDLKATILVTSTGQTLYEYLGDDPAHKPYPNCRNDPTYHCTKTWPPLLTKGAPVAGKGAQQKLLGTVKRPEGTLQVTYAGHPLYRWVGSPPDTKASDVFGQNVGPGLWYVLAPSGKSIKTPRH